MTPRAPALPPAERRRALIEATLPLLAERGDRISTAEIARAAGVAEGTIFRVFTSKDELIDETLTYALDPGPTLARLQDIDRTMPLARRLVEVVSIWQRQVHQVSRVMASMYACGAAGAATRTRPHSPQEHRRRNEEVVASITKVIGADADRLRLPAAEVASLVRSMAFATSHPMISDHAVTDPEVVVQILLHGLTTEENPC